MPGPAHSRSKAALLAGVWICVLPFLMMLPVHLGHDALWLQWLIMGLPLLGLGPWLYRDWRLARSENTVVVEMKAHMIRYTHRSSTYVIPVSAIRMVAVLRGSTPGLTLKLDWSDDRIECPRGQRDQAICWPLETYQQAGWLVAKIGHIVQVQSTARGVPEALKALVSSAAASRPEAEG